MSANSPAGPLASEASRCRLVNSSNPTSHGSWPGECEVELHASAGLCRDRPLTVTIPSDCGAPAVITYGTPPPLSRMYLFGNPFCRCHARRFGRGYAWQLLASQDVATPSLSSVCPVVRRLTAVESSSSRSICQQSGTFQRTAAAGSSRTVHISKVRMTGSDSGNAIGVSWRAGRGK